jgi:hypothetical protein
MPLSEKHMQDMTTVMEAAMIQAKALASRQQYFEAVDLYSDDVVRCIRHAHTVSPSEDVSFSAEFEKLIKRSFSQLQLWMEYLDEAQKRQIDRKLSSNHAEPLLFSALDIQRAESIIRQGSSLPRAKIDQIRMHFDKMDDLINRVLFIQARQPQHTSIAKHNDHFMSLASSLQHRMSTFRERNFTREAFEELKEQCAHDFATYRTMQRASSSKKSDSLWASLYAWSDLDSVLRHIFDVFFDAVGVLFGKRSTSLLVMLLTVKKEIQPSFLAPTAKQSNVCTQLDSFLTRLYEVLDELEQVYDTNERQGNHLLLTYLSPF